MLSDTLRNRYVRVPQVLGSTSDITVQGFSKEITFPRERWVGYIKDYDSANLMMVGSSSSPEDARIHDACILVQDDPKSQVRRGAPNAGRPKSGKFHEMMSRTCAEPALFQAVLAKIQTISQSHVVRPGLALFKDRKPGETITLAKEDIPGLGTSSC